MAKLTFIEKSDIEQILGMGSGYVLDFSNRTFQEFVGSILEIDIYKKYPGLSKAKILREIIEDYDDVSVGKFLLLILQYQQRNEALHTNNKELFERCVFIGNRLIGRGGPAKVNFTNHPESVQTYFDFDKYLNLLRGLSQYEDKQARGFAFEKYLNDLFAENQLDPRGSFKIIGEQIDGSFILHNEVYLLEAKWRNSLSDKSDLVIFNEKVNSKSGFTRGLFVSYAGFSKEATDTFANGRTVNIVLMTVQELAIMLERKIDLKIVLWNKVRALAEEGNFNKTY